MDLVPDFRNAQSSASVARSAGPPYGELVTQGLRNSDFFPLPSSLGPAAATGGKEKEIPFFLLGNFNLLRMDWAAEVLHECPSHNPFNRCSSSPVFFFLF